MFQDNELFNLFLAVAVLVFILAQLRRLKRLPKGSILLLAYSALCLGLISTIIESVLWPAVMNVAEHVCHALSALLFSSWCWVGLSSKERNRP